VSNGPRFLTCGALVLAIVAGVALVSHDGPIRRQIEMRKKLYDSRESAISELCARMRKIDPCVGTLRVNSGELFALTGIRRRPDGTEEPCLVDVEQRPELRPCLEGMRAEWVQMLKLDREMCALRDRLWLDL